MKKFFTAIVAMMLAAPSFAQFASGGFELDNNSVYYGARLGLTLASMSGDNDLSGLKSGLTLGGVVGLRVSPASPVFLESGFYYTQRGGKDGDLSMTLKNLEIPIIIKYGIQASDKVAILPFLGPYFSWGIGGKFKNDKIDFEESSYNYVNHGDMGVKLGCGLEYDLLYLEVGYQFGVANIADDKGTVHSNALVLNFGVNF